MDQTAPLAVVWSLTGSVTFAPHGYHGNREEKKLLKLGRCAVVIGDVLWIDHAIIVAITTLVRKIAMLAHIQNQSSSFQA